MFALSIYTLLQRAVPEKGLGLSPVCLFRSGKEVGHCESLNSLPQEPVHICKLSVFLQFHSLAHLLLLTLTFYRILSWCPLLGVNTEERKKERMVKYLGHEKRAYKHEIWSFRISETASYNRSFWRVQRD